MIDQFTKEQFEQALDNIIPLGWLPLGMELNEYCYTIEVNANARIHIRSSIGVSGIADEAGQDSIRLNLEVWQPDFRRNGNYEWIALPKKAIEKKRWITRVSGWQSRLEEGIRLRWDIAKEFRQPVEQCPCSKSPFVSISKSKKNKGRPYSSCLEKHGGCGLFMWLDKPLEGKVRFDEVHSEEMDRSDQLVACLDQGQSDTLQLDDSQRLERFCGQGDNVQGYANLQSLPQESQETRTAGVENDSLSLQPPNEAIPPSIPEETQAEKPMQDANTQYESALQDSNTEGDTTRECLQEVLEDSKEKEPNPKQLEAIQAPTDANIRVLAPPGSGKTFVIEQRYKYLVDNGIDPDNILVVTFSKSMADEMASRILDTCPLANIEQISTIHAFCYRLLTKWDKGSNYYDWKVAGGTGSPVKSWEIKKWLDDFIAGEWGKHEEKPGYQEVLKWIDTSKYHGFWYDSPECLEWFIETLGLLYGKRVYDIRCKFDKALHQRKCMTFADMLLLTELKLKEDFAFKVWCQQSWSHIMIDEMQDINEQAIRILLGIAEHSFCVGDVDQMMFRFQGAKPEISTSDYAPDIQTVLLGKNYRSTENIIFSSQQLISYNYGELCETCCATGELPVGHPDSSKMAKCPHCDGNGYTGGYNPEFIKDVSGVRGDGEGISFQMYPTIEAEALAITETIQEMIANGYQEGDFFIGARTRAQLGYLEGPLVRKGIKFISLCGGSFWQSKHVADVVAYLRLAYDTSNSDALKRVYNIPSASHKYTWNSKDGKHKASDYCPTRYLGQEFLTKINDDFNKIDRVLLSRDAWRYKTGDKHICSECNKKTFKNYGSCHCGGLVTSEYEMYGPSKAQDLQEFVWSLQGILDQAEDIGQVIRVIIDDCYEKYLKATEGFTGSDESENGKLEDLRTVEDIASEYSNPAEFLAFVDESIKAAEDAKNGNWDDYVVLSTYHRLKGLERPVVFGTGWCEGFITTKDGREEPRGLLPHTFSLIPPPQFGTLPGGEQSPIEDERCIAFVCISRAKDFVFLSGCQQYREWQLFPSRFIQETGIENRTRRVLRANVY